MKRGFDGSFSSGRCFQLELHFHQTDEINFYGVVSQPGVFFLRFAFFSRLSWITFIDVDLGGQTGRATSPTKSGNTDAFFRFYHTSFQEFGFDPPIFLTSLRQCSHASQSVMYIIIIENDRHQIHRLSVIIVIIVFSSSNSSKNFVNYVNGPHQYVNGPRQFSPHRHNSQI